MSQVKSDYSPESPTPQCNDLQSKPTLVQSIIPLDRLESEGEANTTSDDDDIKIIEEVSGKKKKTKVFRKYWEDFEDEAENSALDDKSAEVEVSIKMKQVAPNENFWKTALANKEEDEEDRPLFSRREDLTSEPLFRRRSSSPTDEIWTRRQSGDASHNSVNTVTEEPPFLANDPITKSKVQDALTIALQKIRKRDTASAAPKPNFKADMAANSSTPSPCQPTDGSQPQSNLASVSSHLASSLGPSEMPTAKDGLVDTFKSDITAEAISVLSKELSTANPESPPLSNNPQATAPTADSDQAITPPDIQPSMDLEDLADSDLKDSIPPAPTITLTTSAESTNSQDTQPASVVSDAAPKHVNFNSEQLNKKSIGGQMAGQFAKVNPSWRTDRGIVQRGRVGLLGPGPSSSATSSGLGIWPSPAAHSAPNASFWGKMLQVGLNFNICFVQFSIAN